MMSGEQANLNKFCKYLTTRLIQGVVQSRLGHKLTSQYSHAHSSSDWFNIKLGENGEVTSEIRASTSNRFPPAVPSVCLDFHVRTCDAQMLPLECWCISFDDTQCDPDVNVRGQVYHQMSTLLKSALSAARVTPAYRYYARKQGIESFIMCYQIYVGEAGVAQLGEGYRTVPLGNIPTPYGTLQLHLFIRTKMSVSGGELEGSTESESATAAALRAVNSSLAVSTEAGRVQDVPFGALLPDSPVDSPCFSVFSASPASYPDSESNQVLSPDKRTRNNSSVTFQLDHTTAQSGSSESTCSGMKQSQPAVTTTHSGESSTTSSSQVGGFHSSSSGGCLFGLDLGPAPQPQPAVQPRPIRLPAPAAHTTSLSMSTNRGSDSDLRPASLPADSAFAFHYQQQRAPAVRKSSAGDGAGLAMSALVCASHSEPSVQQLANELHNTMHIKRSHTQGNRLPRLAEHSPPGGSNGERSRAHTTPDALFAADDLESSDDNGFVKIPLAAVGAAQSNSNGNGQKGELGALVQQCKLAPTQLQLFAQQTDSPETGIVASGGEALPGQLQHYTQQMHVFDAFLQQLNQD